MSALRRLTFLTLFLLASRPVLGQSATTASASHTVSIGIQAITVMAVSGDPLPLTAVRDAGGAIRVQDASSHYNLTSNVDDVRIEAVLDFPMPDGFRLRMRADTGLGQSRGVVNVSDASRARTLVGSIGRGLENGRFLEYELLIDPQAEPVPMQERRVTLSIVNPRTGFRQEVTQVVTFSLEEAPGSDILTEPSN